MTFEEQNGKMVKTKEQEAFERKQVGFIGTKRELPGGARQRGR